MSHVEVYEWTREWALASGAKLGLKLWSALEATSTSTIAKEDEEPATKPVLFSKDGISNATLYITKNQTSGRGRGDHVWIMPPSSSLTASWSFGMRKAPQPILSPLVGLALFESTRET